MAFSYIDFGTSGDLTSAQQGGLFTPTTLKFVSSADIFVTRTTTAGVKTTLSASQFTVTTSPSLSVQVKTAAQGGIDLAASDLLRIGRVTPITELSRTFTDGSVLKASDMNTQNSQFLYSVQESKDNTDSSMPIDTDGKFDAGSRSIKNLATPDNENEAVTLQYVNNLALYGAAYGAADPQYWAWTTAAGDIVGNDRVLTLTGPVPGSAINNMYIIEVSGVMQRPSTNGVNGDYDVTEVGGTYTLKLFNAAVGQSQAIANGVEIVVRNFGVARPTFLAPFKAGSTSGTALELEKITDQTGNFIKADDASGTDYFRVQVDGTVVVGDGANTANTTSTFGASGIEQANHDTSSNTAYGSLMQVVNNNEVALSLQGNNSTADSDTAVQIHKGQTDGSVDEVFKVTYGGAITATGTLNVTGIATATGGFATTAISNMGSIAMAAAGTFSTGAGNLAITYQDITDASGIRLKNWESATERTIGNVTGPGGLGFSPTAHYFGFGGNGTGVAYGGTSRLQFTDGSNAKMGGHVGVNSTGPFVGGFRVTEGQGGATGETGSTPARLTYSTTDGNFPSVAYTAIAAADIPAKAQVDQAIATSAAATQASNKYQLLGSHTFSNDAFLFSAAADETWHTSYSSLEIVYSGVTSNYRIGVGVVVRDSAGAYTYPTGKKISSLLTASAGNDPAFQNTSQQSNGAGSGNTLNTDGVVVRGPSVGNGTVEQQGRVRIDLEPDTMMFEMKAHTRNTSGTSVGILTTAHYGMECDTDKPISRLSFASHTDHVSNNRGTITSGQVRIYGIKR